MYDNSFPRPPKTLKDDSETVIDSNNDYFLSADDSYEDIDYVDASPLDSELASLEVMEIVIPEVGGIDTDILLTIKDDILILHWKYDCFYFKSEPDPGEFDSIVDSGIHKNVLPTTNVNLPFEDDQSPLLAYVVWIFLPFLTYPVTPPYLLSCGNKDTIFDPDIFVYHSFMPSVSHRSGTFNKFNVYPNHLNESPMEILSSTCSPLIISSMGDVVVM
ncbi:hypothetical protein Tco_0443059 [Tanacetum coccineum]